MIRFALKKPIIGYGPDNLKDEYLRAGINQDRPHNLIIYLACVSGFPGMLLYVTAVGIIVIIGIKKLFKGDQNAKIYLMIVIAYLISSMFGNSMYYTSPYFFIFLGLNFPSIISEAISSAACIACTYILLVVATEECPNLLDTAGIDAPSAIRIVA